MMNIKNKIINSIKNDFKDKESSLNTVKKYTLIGLKVYFINVGYKELKNTILK